MYLLIFIIFIYYLIKTFIHTLYLSQNKNFSKSDYDQIERIKKRSPIKIDTNQNIEDNDNNYGVYNESDFDEKNIKAIICTKSNIKYKENNDNNYDDKNIEIKYLENVTEYEDQSVTNSESKLFVDDDDEYFSSDENSDNIKYLENDLKPKQDSNDIEGNNNNQNINIKYVKETIQQHGDKMVLVGIDLNLQ